MILALLVFALGLLPPLRSTCACTAKAGEPASCCLQSSNTASCCCSTGGCCSLPTEPASCCSSGETGCQCAAERTPRDPVRLPGDKATASEVSAALSQPIASQLPALIPVIAAGCQLPRFGPPEVGPSLQIAFCVWRN